MLLTDAGDEICGGQVSDDGDKFGRVTNSLFLFCHQHRELTSQACHENTRIRT